MKILSIAIPTYNRANFLRIELENIIPQLQCFSDKVEIAISDNCSTDDTGQMVKEVSQKYSFPIAYKRLDKNIDFEDNFESAVNMTSGKYVHMMGDDDIYSLEFYRVLFDLMEKNYGIIYFNRLSGDAKCCNSTIYDKNFDGLLCDMSMGDFIKRCMTGPGFMSSTIFKKECWDNGTKDMRMDFYGYHFLGRIYHGALNLNERGCYYYLPMVLMRNPSRSWGAKYPLYHFVGLSNIFKSLDDKIPGIYERWLTMLHCSNNRKNNMLLLSSIASDKSFFCLRKKEFWPFLNKREKVAYNILLSHFSGRIVRGIYTRLINLIMR